MHREAGQAAILPAELSTALRAYELAGLVVTGAAQREQESAEYGACRFVLDERTVVFRVARTTPTKIGQFVTIWKRPMPGADIVPLDLDDGVDFVVVSVVDSEQHGQFIFDQAALLKHGVMSRDGHGGKRAIRVYPPWSLPLAAAAIKSQQWQLRYYVPLSLCDSSTAARLRTLLLFG
jgi:hypothetical protein